MKSTIDFKKPQTYDFLVSKPKKEELEDIRNTEIMRENRVLLDKIGNITLQGRFILKKEVLASNWKRTKVHLKKH